MYDLNGDYLEFHAVIGVEEAADRPVLVKIEGDGIELASVTLTCCDKDKPPAVVVRNIKD